MTAMITRSGYRPQAGLTSTAGINRHAAATANAQTGFEIRTTSAMPRIAALTAAICRQGPRRPWITASVIARSRSWPSRRSQSQALDQLQSTPPQASKGIVPIALPQVMQAASHERVRSQRHNPPTLAIHAVDPVPFGPHLRREERILLRAGMFAACSPIATHMPEPSALLGGAKKELVIHREVIAGIDHSDLREQFASPEGALVAERHAVIPVTDGRERGEARLPDHIVTLIDVETVCKHDV